jgi:hypothetical protein
MGHPCVPYHGLKRGGDFSPVIEGKCRAENSVYELNKLLIAAIKMFKCETYVCPIGRRGHKKADYRRDGKQWVYLLASFNKHSRSFICRSSSCAAGSAALTLAFSESK